MSSEIKQKHFVEPWSRRGAYVFVTFLIFCGLMHSVGIVPSQASSGIPEKSPQTIPNKGEPITVSTIVFNDLNGNGEMQQGENGLSRVEVCYVSTYDNSAKCGLTNENGVYTDSLLSGTFRDVITAPTGYSCTNPCSREFEARSTNPIMLMTNGLQKILGFKSFLPQVSNSR